jgi:hypothetical protein
VPVSPDLTTDLKKVVLTLEDDLRSRVESQPDVLAQWQAQHREAVAASAPRCRGRRGATTGSRRRRWPGCSRPCSSGSARTTGFSRRCGSPALLPAARRPWTPSCSTSARTPSTPTGSGSCRPSSTCAALEATRDLVEAHSPLWTVSPSGQAAKALLSTFWRARRDDGSLVLGLHRPRPVDPLPRRPLPGPLRLREEDLRPAPDPGVRRGVHPRPDAGAGARRAPARGLHG